jgi:hypothetical protein
LGQCSASIGATVTRSFPGTGELPVERDQRVGGELGQCDVPGVEGAGPAEQDGGLPCDVLQDAVPEQPDPQLAHVLKLPLGILPGHLTAAHGLVQKRQHLRAQQRRSQDLMSAADHGLVPEPGEWRRPDRSRTWSWKMSSPQLGLASACHRVRECQARLSAWGREPGWAGCAKERPVLSGPDSRLTVGSPGHRRRSGPATSGVCARGAAGPAAVLAAHRAGARRGPGARWPGRLALAAARRAARAACRRHGCTAAASRSSSPDGVPADLAGYAAGLSRHPGTPARCPAARPGAVPHPPLARAPRPGRCQRPGSGRDAVPGPAPDDRPAPPCRAGREWA